MGASPWLGDVGDGDDMLRQILSVDPVGGLWTQGRMEV